MKRPRIVLLGALLSCTAALATLAALQSAPAAFPHLQHERLFPVCQGCHAGVTTGTTTDLYPKPADCAQCHDGTRQKAVDWAAPSARVSNLAFSHVVHFAKTATAGQTGECQSCHAASGRPTRMNVGAPNPALCVRCHEHNASEHLAVTADCKRCHVPLARATALPASRLSKFPKPPWHDSASFVSTHGRAATGDPQRASTCAVCHARETCERCHANANRLTLVNALGRDDRVAALERDRAPAYPAPPSHANEDWALIHGGSARSETASCANCHTQPSCTACHLFSGGKARAVIAALPSADIAPGVSRSAITGTVHPADIARRHGSLAATGKVACTACHTQESCAVCHAGSDSRAFHAANFVERHATDAFARSSDCQSCHNTEKFCRDCHARVGIAAQSGMNAAFHTGQPLWFLSHGQAARTGLESCAACHRQNDCVRCHSAVGGWRINPHGPGFRADRISDRNAASCRWCHTTIPIGGAP